MLVFLRDLKVGKDDDKDKNVVNRQRFFNQIAGEKFKPACVTAFIKTNTLKASEIPIQNRLVHNASLVLISCGLRLMTKRSRAEQKDDQRAKGDPHHRYYRESYAYS